MTEIGRLAGPLDIGGVTIRNRVFLAPMSGVTDDAFRRRAHDHGAGLVVSEMVASGELAKGRLDSGRRIRHSGLPVHMVQLAGREAGAMAEAAKIATGEGADIIDINMGCPAKKVTGGYCGSALMRVPDLAISLIDAVVGAVDVPVTVKMRLGWDDDERNAPLLAQRAEQAGVRMVTVHGRTRCQFYQGTADWNAVAQVKQAVSVPVVVNGDVCSASDAAEALRRSGADAVMVGRGSYGAPWLPGAIAQAAGSAAGIAAPAAGTMGDYVISHYEDMLSLYGVAGGLRHARKHLGWYLDRYGGEAATSLRPSIMTATDPATTIRLLRDAFSTDPTPELREAA
jgi:nifR3 family TIM-barrel protein